MPAGRVFPPVSSHLTSQWEGQSIEPEFLFSLFDILLFVLVFKERLSVPGECELPAFLLHQTGEHLAYGEIQEAGDLS